MAEFLANIVRHVREEVERKRQAMPLSVLRDRPLYHRAGHGLAAALTGGSRRIIAEVKRASPSRGLIRQDFDAVAIACDYAAHGASAVSVLTEERFFQGSLLYLEQIRNAITLPLLRKDFILDPYQLFEAKSYGADAVLFIAAMVEPALLRELCEQATALSLDALVEVHTEAELQAALQSGAQIVGINNRDLKSFAVDLTVTEKLAPLVPPGTPAVCESGIDSLEQIEWVEQLGVHSFLIGEALMRAPEPGKKLGELLGRSQSANH